MNPILDAEPQAAKSAIEGQKPHTVSGSKPRLEFLDSLRGIAALYVLIYHVTFIPEPDLFLPQWAKMIVMSGGMGVTLFFVVSAFSLFYTMQARLSEPNPWLSFFIHRFFRIAPLFYFLIILSLWRDEKMLGLSHSWSEVAFSAGFLFNLLPQGQDGFVWASWTIGVEFLFYALFPLFYFFAKNKQRALVWAMLLLIAWYSVKASAIYFTSDAKTLEMFSKWSVLRHLPIFACGAVAYHMMFERDRVITPSHDTGMLLATGALFLYVSLLNGWLPNIFGDSYYWQGILFAMLLLGLAHAPMRLLVNWFTRYLGRISYSLYLNHPTIIFLLTPIYIQIQKSLTNPSLSIAACLVLTTAICVVVSELTYRLIEVPGINFGKHLNQILRNRARL